MEPAVNRGSDLDRAFVQCRVIETGLHHLAATLSTTDDAALRGDLADYALRFEGYVRRLNEAREACRSHGDAELAEGETPTASS
jgi:hypothetical protein